MELPYDPVILLLGMYLKKPKTLIWKNVCTLRFITALTIAKIWKQPKCPSGDKWITKLWYIYTMGYYSAIQKKENLPFVTAWMDLESIMLREISQRKTNTVWFQSHEEAKEHTELTNQVETDSWIQRTDWQLSEGRGLGVGCAVWKD